eukprot:CFRG7446T1
MFKSVLLGLVLISLTAGQENIPKEPICCKRKREGTLVPRTLGAITRYCSTYTCPSGYLPREDQDVTVCVQGCNIQTCCIDDISGICGTDPCFNDASCTPDETLANFTCECPEGYGGDLCEYFLSNTGELRIALPFNNVPGVQVTVKNDIHEYTQTSQGGAMDLLEDEVLIFPYLEEGINYNVVVLPPAGATVTSESAVAGDKAVDGKTVLEASNPGNPPPPWEVGVGNNGKVEVTITNPYPGEGATIQLTSSLGQVTAREINGVSVEETYIFEGLTVGQEYVVQILSEEFTVTGELPADSNIDGKTILVPTPETTSWGVDLVDTNVDYTLLLGNSPAGSTVTLTDTTTGKVQYPVVGGTYLPDGVMIEPSAAGANSEMAEFFGLIDGHEYELTVVPPNGYVIIAESTDDGVVDGTILFTYASNAEPQANSVSFGCEIDVIVDNLDNVTPIAGLTVLLINTATDEVTEKLTTGSDAQEVVTFPGISYGSTYFAEVKAGDGYEFQSESVDDGAVDGKTMLTVTDAETAWTVGVKDIESDYKVILSGVSPGTTIVLTDQDTGIQYYPTIGGVLSPDGIIDEDEPADFVGLIDGHTYDVAVVPPPGFEIASESVDDGLVDGQMTFTMGTDPATVDVTIGSETIDFTVQLSSPVEGIRVTVTDADTGFGHDRTGIGGEIENLEFAQLIEGHTYDVTVTAPKEFRVESESGDDGLIDGKTSFVMGPDPITWSVAVAPIPPVSDYVVTVNALDAGIVVSVTDKISGEVLSQTGTGIPNENLVFRLINGDEYDVSVSYPNDQLITESPADDNANDGVHTFEMGTSTDTWSFTLKEKAITTLTVYPSLPTPIPGLPVSLTNTKTGETIDQQMVGEYNEKVTFEGLVEGDVYEVTLHLPTNWAAISDSYDSTADGKMSYVATDSDYEWQVGADLAPARMFVTINAPQYPITVTVRDNETYQSFKQSYTGPAGEDQVLVFDGLKQQKEYKIYYSPIYGVGAESESEDDGTLDGKHTFTTDNPYPDYYWGMVLKSTL